MSYSVSKWKRRSLPVLYENRTEHGMKEEGKEIGYIKINERIGRAIPVHTEKSNMKSRFEAIPFILNLEKVYVELLYTYRFNW